LITRSAEGDSFDVMGPIAAVQPATDHQAYLGYLRRPELAAATITVSEAGYLRGPDGHLDLGRAVITADLAALQGNIEAPVSSLPGKLVAGLLARRAADAGPISILSCDNLPENGAVTRAVVTDLAAVVDATLQTWMEQNVDFATSMVDRITPATTAEERSLVAKAQGYEDASPVPTEPFAEWVISGRFPNGRAAWEDAGARLVEDITPYEQRKLWLLNASHSLLAYAGSICGHATIDEAIGDPQCRSWVEALWEESCRHLTLRQPCLRTTAPH
jgi:fructuronate reductase